MNFRYFLCIYYPLRITTTLFFHRQLLRVHTLIKLLHPLIYLYCLLYHLTFLQLTISYLLQHLNYNILNQILRLLHFINLTN